MADRYNRAALAIFEVLGDRVEGVVLRGRINILRDANDKGAIREGFQVSINLISREHTVDAYESLEFAGPIRELSPSEILELSMKAVVQFLEEDDCRRCGRGYSATQKEEILAEAKARIKAVLAGEEVRHG